MPTPPLWADFSASPLRTPQAGRLHADLVVIGLGAAGLEAAASAAADGLDVVGIDAGPIGGGASGRNGGFLLAGAADFHHVLAARIGASAATELYVRTLAELEAQCAHAAGAVRRVGSIRLAVSAEEMADCREQARIMRRDGLPVAEVTGPFGAGLHHPFDATMHPGQRCTALASRARTAGARLLPSHRVTALDDETVHAGRLQVRAAKVLVTVNAGVDRLVPALRGSVRSARAQMLATAPGTVGSARVPAAMYARWGLDYWQRLPDGRVAMGGARDKGGDHEWTVRPGVSRQVQSALEQTLRREVTDGRAPTVTHRWSGLLAFTPDRLPLCRLVRPGLAVAGGYCGTGNVMGPLTARAALRLLLGRADPWADLLARVR